MWLLTKWRLVLTVSSLFALLLMTSLWRAATAERDQVTSEYRSYRQAAEAAATAAKKETEQIAKELSDDYHAMVEQAEKNAYRNYLARYGSPRRVQQQPAEAGLRDTVPATGDRAEASRTGGADDRHSDFVADCARSTVIAHELQEFVRKNELPIIHSNNIDTR